MKTSITSFGKKVAIFTGLALGALALTATAANYVGPSGAAPICPDGYSGCDAPLNIGYGAQTKQGGLILNSKLDAANFMTYGLWVVNKPIKAEGGLIIETRTTAQGNPSSPETGRMWLMVP
jgi:hypothetical protein